MYTVKEIFGPTLQGEGPHAGSPCVFVRLSGCNAWDGRPETRAASACPYCDTDFRGGDRLSVDDIIRHTRQLLADQPHISDTAIPRYGCVLSGGEPLLQADSDIINQLAAAFDWVDIETNGTRGCPPHPSNVSVICSPKQLTNEPIVVEADAWKILIPAQEHFLDRALASGKPVFLQPVCPDSGPSGQTYTANLQSCIALCQQHGCRLSLQLHKYIGVE